MNLAKYVRQFTSFKLSRRAFHEFKEGNSYILKDDLSRTHAFQLETTLKSHFPQHVIANILPEQPLPLGSHLIYFNHSVPEDELDPDGYDHLQAPLSANGTPLLRRWLKGTLKFNHENPLRFGEDAFCIETVNNEDSSSRRNKHIVNIERDMRPAETPDHFSIQETRVLFYIEPNDRILKRMKQLVAGKPVDKDTVQPTHTHQLRVTKALLFRYSALCFNAHSIHYDPEYAKSVEGLGGVVVPGPLMVTLILRWMAQHVVPQSAISFMSYENIGSILAGDQITLGARQVSPQKWDAWITRTDQSSDERICFASSIRAI